MWKQLWSSPLAELPADVLGGMLRGVLSELLDSGARTIVGKGQQESLFPNYNTLVYVTIVFPHNSHSFGFFVMKMLYTMGC